MRNAEPRCTNGPGYDRFSPSEELPRRSCGNSSVGRAQPCQGWGRGFESRFPLSDNRTDMVRTDGSGEGVAPVFRYGRFPLVQDVGNGEEGAEAQD